MKRTRRPYSNRWAASRGLDHTQLADHAGDQTTRYPCSSYSLLQHLLLHAHRVSSCFQSQLLRKPGCAAREGVAVADGGAFGIDVENGVVVDVVEDGEDTRYGERESRL